MIQNRLLKYIFLLFGSFMIPFFVTFLMVTITESRISGLYYFALPSIFLVHFIFSFTQVNKNWRLKIALALAAIVLSGIITFVPLYLDISFEIDRSNYWDVIIFFAIGTISAWEILFQIDKRIIISNLKV